MVCIALFVAIGELQRKRFCQSHATAFAGMDKLVDNFCKQRTGCLRRFFVIVYTEHGQWQASFLWEKSAHLAEVSVTEQIFPNSQKY